MRWRERCIGGNVALAGTLRWRERCVGGNVALAGTLRRRERCVGGNVASAGTLHQPRAMTCQPACNDASTRVQRRVNPCATTRQPACNDNGIILPRLPHALSHVTKPNDASTLSISASQRNFAIAMVPTSLISKTLITALALHYSLPSIQHGISPFCLSLCF